MSSRPSSPTPNSRPPGWGWCFPDAPRPCSPSSQESGWPSPPASSSRSKVPQLWAARRGIALRALVIGAVGLSLGGLEVNIAIILVHYAVLFLCVLPFLGLDVKHLLVLAAGWVLVSPAVAFLLRPWLLAAEPPLQLGHNPMWEDLSTPSVLLGDLFLTGYYPVLQWITLSADRPRDRPAGPHVGGGPGPAAGGGNRGGGPCQVAQRRADGGLGRPGGAAGFAARSLVSAGEPPAGQPGRRGPDRLRLVARLQRPAFGHHAGSAAHLGGGGRRRWRLPAPGPAGRRGPGWTSCSRCGVQVP